jgi:hypothetical protein
MITYSSTPEATQKPAEFSSYIHPDYNYYSPDWVHIRDAMAGERRVKDKGEEYLPTLETDSVAYAAYQGRAVFVNMVSRTVLGMVGTVFRRPLKVFGVEKGDIKNVTKDGLSLNDFAKKAALELCSVGRIGILADMQEEVPYLTEYLAENILSWRTATIKGKEQLIYVLLREIGDDTPMLEGDGSQGADSVGKITSRFRVLRLKNGVYQQYVYDWGVDDEDILKSPVTVITPTRGGATFDYIPMVIPGAIGNTVDVQRSPVIDIVSINFAHYRTSAQLEHGRFYTALPVYYTEVPANVEVDQEYTVGPSVVWEVPEGSKPGIIEYFGTGLASLERSLTEKEEHIAQLGGRIMGIRPAATAESDNIYRMKQANEISILMNITDSLGAALTQVMTWYLGWQRKPTKDLLVRLNQDFKSLNIAARELRALALLHQQNILPIQAVYEALQSSEFIPEDWTFVDFQEYLNNADNFPNQPDAQAMREGFSDADARQRSNQLDQTHQHEFDLAEQDEKVQKQLQQATFRQAQSTARLADQRAAKKPVVVPKKDE